jgi:hypothetical protein
MTGDGVLTKQALDAVTRDFRAWRDERPAPSASAAAPGAPKSPPNAGSIKAVVSAVAPYIHALETQIAALQARVAELETRPEARYLGVWGEKEYSVGSLVTDGGALWHCNKRTRDRPGVSADWTLAQKSDPAAARPPSATAHARNGSAGLPARPRLP